MLKDYLNKNNMSVYSLSKGSGVPYTTVNELVNNKKNIDECSLKTVSKLAAYLGVTVEGLYYIANSKRGHSVKPATSWNDAREKKFAFPVVAPSEFYDASRIYPLKQKLVSEIYNKLQNDDRISELILFGSSTTIRCNNKSDIDFAVKLMPDFVTDNTKDEISEKIQEICNWKADIIWMDKISKNSRIYKNISRGVRLV